MPFDALPPHETSAAALLLYAARLIADEDHWCQGKLHERSKNWVRSCAMGAVYVASARMVPGRRVPYTHASNLLHRVADGRGYNSMVSLNDSKTHANHSETHAEVLATFRDAIAIAQAEEAAALAETIAETVESGAMFSVTVPITG